MMRDVTPFWWGVLILGGGAVLVGGFVTGVAKAFTRRERRDGQGRG